jgi:hypothetical protein
VAAPGRDGGPGGVDNDIDGALMLLPRHRWNIDAGARCSGLGEMFRGRILGNWQLTLLATLGGFLFGYDTSNIGSALNFVPYHL